MSSKSSNSTGHEPVDGTLPNAALNALRQRRVLMLLAGTVVVAAVVFNWQWLVAAGLLPVLLLLPCMIMMFRCMRHGAGNGCDKDKAAEPANATSH